LLAPLYNDIQVKENRNLLYEPRPARNAGLSLKIRDLQLHLRLCGCEKIIKEHADHASFMSARQHNKLRNLPAIDLSSLLHSEV